MILTVISDSKPDNTWRSVSTASEAIPALISRASDAKLRLSGVTVKPRSLRNIYLDLSSCEREGTL